MTSWTSWPTEEAFITLRALGRVALTRDVVLNHILSMGIYDWKDTDKQGGGMISIQYAAVLGNRLLQRIERGDDKVGFVA